MRETALLMVSLFVHEVSGPAMPASNSGCPSVRSSPLDPNFLSEDSPHGFLIFVLRSGACQAPAPASPGPPRDAAGAGLSPPVGLVAPGSFKWGRVWCHYSVVSARLPRPVI